MRASQRSQKPKIITVKTREHDQTKKASFKCFFITVTPYNTCERQDKGGPSGAEILESQLEEIAYRIEAQNSKSCIQVMTVVRGYSLFLTLFPTLTLIPKSLVAVETRKV